MSAKGFTLIELMVVMTIIAILATIGLAAYSNVQKSARDSRRLEEIQSVAKALESKKALTGSYSALAATDFASGSIPIDPKSSSVTNETTTGCGSNNCFYCFSTAAGNCTGSNNTIDQAPGTSWYACANLEGSINGNSYYCVANQQ